MVDNIAFDYLFGFGSIINTDTHAPWMPEEGSQSLLGQRANILASFGYRRGWNFRSNTGFTALGITRDDKGVGSIINGVLFQIPRSMLPAFDRREVGYDRQQMSPEHLDLLQGADSADGLEFNISIIDGARLWVYVPKQSFCHESNEDHPILQSYVDTVMQGCLQWGGEEMAAQFVATTFCWSLYFLNDNPSSRRPWLFRKQYNTIDSILSQHPATHFVDRRHPEEFASAFLIKMMRGTWSVPRRNSTFTGRDSELSQIHARLLAQKSGQHYQTGVATVEIAGMGGVGKTQLCTEYCYRSFPSYYGLVIWVSAQGAESIVTCYRQLMVDTTDLEVRDMDTDVLISEVKARLFRSKSPWLLVFDNLEDRALLQKFVPHGSTCGHVLVTTRSVETDVNDPFSMVLGCFHPSESVELLCRSANICGDSNVTAASQLAVELGHLPLALSMAAAYMIRCDVDCSEYLVRYVNSERNKALLGHQVVESSLALSLNAIKTESQFAWEVLRLLCWLGPDQISKALLRTLLRAKDAYSLEQAKRIAESKALAACDAKALEATVDVIRTISQTALLGGLSLLTSFALERHSKGSGRLIGLRVAFNSMAAACMAATFLLSYKASGRVAPVPIEANELPSTIITRSTSYSCDEYEQADSIWKILKSFSLLVVKDAKGSIHRLLAQALRKSQTESESLPNLKICVRAIHETWIFKPEQIGTWQESASVLEHLKAVVLNSIVVHGSLQLETAFLSREAGVYSAMALNRFEEAEHSLLLSLEILDKIREDTKRHCRERAATLFELGRVLRYLGRFRKSEDALKTALSIRDGLVRDGLDERHGVAATLHELGVLEMKKHNLDSATNFLERALALRALLRIELSSEGIEADCAATLHQLAAVHLARKPPTLIKAEQLLQEALGLTMQIGQRAATLKQLARVAMRRGDLDHADQNLSQALDLYVELYGEAALHVNVAAVKFQQGALALQREQLAEAWQFYSECLSARRFVYSYTKGNHIEVSSVLHELGRVAFAQRNTIKSQEMLLSERNVLHQLCESSTHHQRLLQARLTNLTWLEKCAKELGDDKEGRKLVAERNRLKRNERKGQTVDVVQSHLPQTRQLQLQALDCRSLARQLALSPIGITDDEKTWLRATLEYLTNKSMATPQNSIKAAVTEFHANVLDALNQSSTVSKISMLKACDLLRDDLRECGVHVSDSKGGRCNCDGDV